MRASQLGRLLAKACTAALATTSLGGCCIFGRSYGPSYPESLRPTDRPTFARADAEGALPMDVCQAVCGGGDELLGCHVATLAIAAKERPRTLVWKYLTEGHSEPLPNGTEAPADLDLSGMDPNRLDPSVCAKLQGSSRDVVSDCHLAPAPPAGPPIGAPFVQCHYYHPGGCDMSFGSGRDTRARRTSITRRTGVGGWLARAAQLERTAVRAFVEHAAELRRFGAPRALVRSALGAARDEVRHARTMTRLARCAGVRVPPVGFRRSEPRSLVDFAIENAVEGCVRELLAAAVALHQSHAAGDPRVRRALRAIARDETRHAALALRTFAWALPELDDDGRARVRGAISDAVAPLLRPPSRHPERRRPGAREPDLPRELGLPDATALRALAQSLDATIWRSLATGTAPPSH